MLIQNTGGGQGIEEPSFRKSAFAQRPEEAQAEIEEKPQAGCQQGVSAGQKRRMVLTDDNFATIIRAVREGRGIYENIRKDVQFLLSSNIGEVLTIFGASLLSVMRLSWRN